MSNEHLTGEQLHLFVDGMLPANEAVAAAAHLRSCSRCRHALEGLQHLATALRNLPASNLGSEFTRNVLRRLDIIPKSPVLFRVVENFAYVFGMMLVLGVMLAVFVLTGAVDSSQVSNTQTWANKAGGAVGEYTLHFASGLSAVLQSYLPFIFGNGNLKIAIMGLAAIGLLAVIDRF
ncbi:MAG: zf-HC2 domain-containing protein, partial [bacterium]